MIQRRLKRTFIKAKDFATAIGASDIQLFADMPDNCNCIVISPKISGTILWGFGSSTNGVNMYVGKNYTYHFEKPTALNVYAQSATAGAYIEYFYYEW